MSKWKLRSCPRCDGDMFTDIDPYGLFEQCLQCGYTSHLIETAQPNQRACNGEEEEEGIMATLSEEL